MELGGVEPPGKCLGGATRNRASPEECSERAGSEIELSARHRRARIVKKAAKKVKKERREKPKQTPAEGNRKAFDQLLDDAIFGVKKKNPRG